jgi:predicted metal-dependent phosphoesterase TrpH
MKIDLHIHSKEGSDGRWPLAEIFAEAHRRGISFLSVSDHDSLEAQQVASELADHYGIRYITGIELNVTLVHPLLTKGKAISLDFLGYGFDIRSEPLNSKLKELRDYRGKRAGMILDKINREFRKEGIREFTHEDMEAIQESADGSLGRPHIANYLIAKKIVGTKQEAFDRFLVKCDVPKMPLSLEEASALVRGAGGRIVIAHPNDPHGTSLAVITRVLAEQQDIIRKALLPLIDGIECWHSRHDAFTSESYHAFARSAGLIVTGGSDCHQQPVIMGSVAVPDCVATQFIV